MTSKARVEFDPQRMTLRAAVVRQSDGRSSHYLSWGSPVVHTVQPDVAASEGAWMHIEEDDARALYEALADYFGHSGHDTRALRNDYDAERNRVDRLITHITQGSKS